MQFGHYMITKDPDETKNYYWAHITYPPYLWKFKNCHTYKAQNQPKPWLNKSVHNQSVYTNPDKS